VHSSFFKPQEKLLLDNWHTADTYTQQILSWLPDIRSKLGKTFCLFNIAWPPLSLIDTVPVNVDTYVLHFGTEYVDWQWLSEFCRRFAHAQVILISPYNNSLYAEPNLTLIQFNFWPQILKWYQEENDIPIVSLTKKTKKISSLANRVSQFRSYVCAHLYKTQDPNDYVMSWRGMIAKQEDLYLFNYTGNNRIDIIIDYIKSTFFDLRIRPDEKLINGPLNNLFYNWSAYTDCVVNCSNESVNNSFQQTDQGSHIVPGTYFTEKTWKCLLSGTALLPVGQYRSYESLSQQGFKFNYPWNCDFDQISKDIDRIDAILSCLDSIKDMSVEFLKSHTQDSNIHNREHILSGNYYNQENLVNLNNVQKFIDNSK